MAEARQGPERRHAEEELAELLGEVREPPAAWVEAAKALPAARAEIESLIARAESDAAFRKQVLADLESALRSEGHEPTPQAIAALRAGVRPD